MRQWRSIVPGWFHDIIHSPSDGEKSELAACIPDGGLLTIRGVGLLENQRMSGRIIANVQHMDGLCFIRLEISKLREDTELVATTLRLRANGMSALISADDDDIRKIAVVLCD